MLVHDITFVNADGGNIFPPVTDIPTSDLEATLGTIAELLIRNGFDPSGAPEGNVDGGYFTVPLDNGAEMNVTRRVVTIH